MSKIFEAIQKGSGAAADIVPALLKDQPVLETPVATAVADPPAEVPAETVADRPAEEPAAVEPPVSTGVRVVPIQVKSDAPVLIFDQPRSRAGEQYRILRTKIIHHPARPKVILVSSPGPGDGKTVTAINLAGALALKVEAKVLLIDTDFRRTRIHKELGLPATPGVTDILAGSSDLESALIRTQQYSNLYVLPSGGSRANPVELLDSPAWHNLMEALRADFEYIVLDSPPIAAVADYLLLQKACDGVVAVLRPDHTNRKLAHTALESIPRDKNLGVVVNCVQEWFLSGSKQRYYYYEESDAR
jgi:capsular exopolysaccharide synthesis family protein